MGLSNQQIERYARQIIVPGVGGIAEERLLSSRIMLAGKASDVASVLAYLVGAGVGEIQLHLPKRDPAEQDSLIRRSNQLNPEVLVKPAGRSVTGLNLVFTLGADPETRELITSSWLAGAGIPVIFCRLDAPARIAVFSGTPPCLLCADTDLLAPSKERENNAGFVTMIAATEAFKLLANIGPVPPPTLVQFSGFTCATRQIRQKSLTAACACSAGRSLVTNQQ
ncbi:MAG: hypothetical protein JO166_08785 [Deltaproteobacteria bacterium]|nr:hypothetical protein [Deltaproteobacteria bacterium]